LRWQGRFHANQGLANDSLPGKKVREVRLLNDILQNIFQDTTETYNILFAQILDGRRFIAILEQCLNLLNKGQLQIAKLMQNLS
jgi:hypothetical protein